MGNTCSKPTLKQLTNRLKNLVYWENFALNLPKIMNSEIQTIQRDHQSSVADQKQALYEVWLKKFPSASWKHVASALTEANEQKLAEDILRLEKYTLPRPTVHELSIKLKDLTEWEKFAEYLPIDQAHIDEIKKDVWHDDPIDQKRNLFDKWLNICPDASWNHVILALEKADQSSIAQSIVSSAKIPVHEETAKDLAKFHEEFLSLANESASAMQEKIKKSKKKFKQLVDCAKKRKAYDLQAKLVKVEKFQDFIDIVQKEYHFLDCKLLKDLVKEFLSDNDELNRKLENYMAEVEKFFAKTEIQDLQNTLYPYIKKEPDEISITIGVCSTYGKENMWIVQTLLQTLLGLNEEEMKIFRIIPGSFTIVVLAPKHLSSAVLVNQSKHKIQFMKDVGVVSLQIDTTFVLQDEANEEYSFEKGFISAINNHNHEAVKFLVDIMNGKTATTGYHTQREIRDLQVRIDTLTKDLEILKQTVQEPAEKKEFRSFQSLYELEPEEKESDDDSESEKISAVEKAVKAARLFQQPTLIQVYHFVKNITNFKSFCESLIGYDKVTQISCDEPTQLIFSTLKEWFKKNNYNPSWYSIFQTLRVTKEFKVAENLWNYLVSFEQPLKLLEKSPKLTNLFQCTQNFKYMWNDIGRCLEVPVSFRDRYMTSKENRSDDIKLEAMLQKWMEMDHMPTTWGSFSNAFQENDLYDVAFKVEEFLSSEKAQKIYLN